MVNLNRHIQGNKFFEKQRVVPESADVAFGCEMNIRCYHEPLILNCVYPVCPVGDPRSSASFYLSLRLHDSERDTVPSACGPMQVRVGPKKGVDKKGNKVVFIYVILSFLPLFTDNTLKTRFIVHCCSIIKVKYKIR